MEIKNTGGPAFPAELPPTLGNSSASRLVTGMTLRDYFAAKVAQSLMADSDTLAGCLASADKRGVKVQEHIAIAAYEVADAMLAERGK